MFKYKALWIVLTSVFAVLFIAMIVGTAIANFYRAPVNTFFGADTYKIVPSENTDVAETEYFKSPYVMNGKTWTGKGAKDGDDAYYDNEALMAADNLVAEEVEAEGATLLFNNNKALPLAKGNKISAFSVTTNNLVYGGTGSGGVRGTNGTKLKTALDESGLKVNPTLMGFYESDNIKKKYTRTVKSFFQTGQYNVKEAPWSEYTDEVKSSFASYGDAAIVVLARAGGEDNDLPRTNNDFLSYRSGSAFGSKGPQESNSTNDGKDGNFLTLTAEESEMMEQIRLLKAAGTVKKVIVLINSVNSLECDFLTENKYDVDAALWIGTVGNVGINAVGDILVGDVVPSGSLPDTFYNDNLATPNMINFGQTRFNNYSSVTGVYSSSLYNGNEKGENQLDNIGADVYAIYEEGIYLGYKYTESRYFDRVMGQNNAGDFDYNALVAYSFGHGESYTDFTYSDMTVTTEQDYYEVSVKVTNTGKTYTGKETVQIYLNAPYTVSDKQNKIEKSAVKLVGFGKTSKLAPDAHEVLKIKVSKETFASYDAFGAKTYVMSEGDYLLTAATDAHNAANNILAYNNKTTADGMTENGNKELVKKAITVDKLDSTTFSKSDDTLSEIKNQFDGADLRIYENGSQASKFKLLSRQNWVDTFPKPTADRNKGDLTFTDQMKKDVTTADPIVIEEDPEAKMPTYGAENNLTLAMMRGIDYDSKAWDDLLDQMTFDEMDLLLSEAGHLTNAIESISKPATRDENGPIGLTKNFMGSDTKCMAYSACPVMAATFNTELINRMGEQIGLDALHANYQGLYGPGANIHRSPYSGRNFEYYSEDSILSGIICQAETRGIQSKGMYVYAKHFALNDQESGRHGICTFASEQTIRENYLTAFEYPLSKLKGNGHAVMTSFNRIGVVWSHAHKGLMTEVLRNEWGFDGFTLTDAWNDIGSSNGCFNFFGNMAAGILVGGDALDGHSKSDLTGAFTIDENYRKSPTFCQALRTSVKKMLYVQAHSSAMNGIGAEDKIVPILAWWQVALIWIDIALGALAAASATLLVITIIKKKKQ